MNKIDAIAERHKYPLKKIYIINASKRTTKLNAFFSGIGKTKTIGIFDNLLDKMSEDEVVAILAHEIGHAKGKHMLRRLPLMILQFLPLLSILALLIGCEPLSLAFGFSETNIAFELETGLGLLSPAMIVLQMLGNIQSRKHEYEADAFEVSSEGAAPSISAMKKLVRENFSNLTPHPFVVFAASNLNIIVRSGS
ncbi:MAG: M48 family metalloprotease [Eubacteriaceae bacterium]|nr:M48 family metalloprotease [Eubacteriaceae bacterium]